MKTLIPALRTGLLEMRGVGTGRGSLRKYVLKYKQMNKRINKQVNKTGFLTQLNIIAQGPIRGHSFQEAISDCIYPRDSPIIFTKNT